MRATKFGISKMSVHVFIPLEEWVNTSSNDFAFEIGTTVDTIVVKIVDEDSSVVAMVNGEEHGSVSINNVNI